jgi:hypothetical protein
VSDAFFSLPLRVPVSLGSFDRTSADLRCVVGCVSWPDYTLDNPQNIVFDVNTTQLAYVEGDYYRAEAIQYISDHIFSQI